MAKEKIEDNNFDIDMEEALIELPIEQPKVKYKESKAIVPQVSEDNLINCLRNERVIVRHVPKEGGMISNPKHILYGGMAENATRTLVVPKLSSGLYAQVLTSTEEKYLEHIMGLEPNALSIYRKFDNFWDDSNDVGISSVRLTKQDTYLDLSSPEDYIKYKILLTNKDLIAPSLQSLQDYPKATYQFVIIIDGEEISSARDNMSATMQCYIEYGKVESDIDTLRVIIESIDSRPTSSNSKLEFLQTQINSLIQSNSKLFLKIIKDPFLNTKVLIKKSIEAGLIANRGNFLYLREDNSPLCENNEEPTINVAARYLNSPKHQNIKFVLEAKLKE